jgi:ABC-type transport system involved in multi-copper enzyme maturation permease subunit
MKWLVWREYRLNWLILIAGSVLLLLPYVIGLINLCWWISQGWRGSVLFLNAFYMAAFYSVILCQLTVALLGGNAIAGERADRSAEFMAYLPLSRPRRLASKLILIVTTMAVLWAVNLAVMLILPAVFPEEGHPFQNPPNVFWVYLAVTALTFFGVGWLISSLQSSPTFAICGALISPLVVYMCLYWAAWARGIPLASSYDPWTGIGYVVICSVVAVVCFAIGTWYYLRRVEP